MTGELTADFAKHFSNGPVIEAQLRCQVDGFSATVLFGPSGCGKTTVLRCLAGLERPERGAIQFAQQTWFDQQRGICLRPQRRQIGYLFQEYALFPHLTVAQNVGYGVRDLPADQRARRVAQMLELFDLAGLENRLPGQISGGQQQRVALARVLACRPRLLLLDEPLSALDSVLRERLRGHLRRVLAECAVPAVIVTHDRTEAIALADRVLVLSQGRVRQAGTPDEVFSRPVDLAVAEIVGVETVVPASIVSQHSGLARIEVSGQHLLAVAPDTGGTLSGTAARVYACIRAEDVVLQKGDVGSMSPQNRLEATVVSLVPEGPLVRVTLDCGFPLTALVTRPACDELALQPGDSVRALIKVPAIHLLPRS